MVIRIFPEWFGTDEADGADLSDGETTAGANLAIAVVASHGVSEVLEAV